MRLAGDEIEAEAGGGTFTFTVPEDGTPGATVTVAIADSELLVDVLASDEDDEFTSPSQPSNRRTLQQGRNELEEEYVQYFKKNEIEGLFACCGHCDRRRAVSGTVTLLKLMTAPRLLIISRIAI